MAKKDNVYMTLLNFSIFEKIGEYDFIKIKNVEIEKDLSSYGFFQIINLTLEIDIGKEMMETMTGKSYVRSQLIEDLNNSLTTFGELKLKIIEI